jgi:hypothetical protein
MGHIMLGKASSCPPESCLINQRGSRSVSSSWLPRKGDGNLRKNVGSLYQPSRRRDTSEFRFFPQTNHVLWRHSIA